MSTEPKGPYRYSVDGSMHKINGPGVVIHERDSRLCDWCQWLNTAYAAGVEAGRAEVKASPAFAIKYQCIDALADRVAALESWREDQSRERGESRLEDAIDSINWQRRAEIAEAQVEAVNDYIDVVLPVKPQSEHDRGMDSAMDDIRFAMRVARERFGAK